MIIRDLAPSDVDAVMAIEAVSFPSPWSVPMFLDEIGRDFSDALVAVGDPGRDVLGYAVCWTVAGDSHLLNIAVRPDARCRGVGTALLLECIRRGAAAGARRIHLEVRPGNEPALRLYRRHGFVFQGIRKGYYTDTREDAVVLSREIREADGS
ncbi:MAG: ribosomal protein S18-alanine N-acetyltransferase [Gemmatimonadota bacterium]